MNFARGRIHAHEIFAGPTQQHALTRLFDHRVTTDRPLLVIAHELYGDADRDQEIAARNRIRHPGFVLAGTVLKALDGGRLD